MTDLQKTIELYKGFGIEVKTYKEGNEIRIDLNGCEDNSTDSDKLIGYGGFYSILFFDLEEKFIKQGFWE